MAVLYVNNFDNIRLIRQISAGADPGKPFPVFNLVSGAVPVYDPPTVLPALGVPSQVVEWGPMYEGASKTSSNGTFVTQPSGPLTPPTGVTVTLHNNGSTAGQSKTLYIVYPNDDLVRRGKVFTAELIFDLPMADNPQVPPGATAPGWSVALNFKTSNQTDDHINDGVIGAMCHFSGNSTVKLHGTDLNAGAGDSTKSYAQYGGSPATEFCLTVELIINQSATPDISGTGSLRYGDQALIGNLVPQGSAFNFCLI